MEKEGSGWCWDEDGEEGGRGGGGEMEEEEIDGFIQNQPQMNADKRRLDLFEQFAFSKNHRGRGGAQRIMKK